MNDTRQLSVAISPQQWDFIGSCVRSGDSLSADEVVRQGIRLLSGVGIYGHGPVYEELQIIFDRVPALIAFVEKDLHYRFVNQAYADFFCRRKRDVIGVHVSTVLGAAFKDVEAHLSNALEGKEERFDLCIPRENSDGHWLEVRYLPSFRSDGQVTGVFVLVMDIDERVRAEKGRLALEAALLESNKLEAVGRLAGGIAHDFNNLLTVVSASAELLAMKPQLSDRDSLNLLNGIQDAASRAAQLTRKLLAFSRQQVLVPEVVCPDVIIDGLMSLLSRTIAGNIQLHFVPHGQGLTIRADPEQIGQVLMNLMLNARDAMPNGGTIRIQVEEVLLGMDGDEASQPRLPSGRYALLSVTDNGAGIGPDQLPHIFEPFYTARLGGGGTGMGLATVYGIVTQSGGQVTVESQVGVGTTFRIYLPACDETAKSVVPDAEDHDVGGHECVLVRDDFTGITAATSGALRLAGYRVLAASSPLEAISLAENSNTPIDILVTDVVMPEMSGPVLANRIREILPHARVLFISGYAGESASRLLAPGDWLLEKPFTACALRRAVRASLDGRILDGQTLQKSEVGVK